MELIFNELSLNDLPDSITDANRAMATLVSLFKEILKRTGLRKFDLRSTISLSDALIATNYPIKEWLKKNNDNASLFLQTTAQKPTVKYPNYYFEGLRCQGLAYAYENSRIALSYNGSRNWNEPEYNLKKEDFNKFPHESFVRVKHLSEGNHITIHWEWLESHLPKVDFHAIKRDIERGIAPDGIIRIDYDIKTDSKGQPLHGQLPHVHFKEENGIKGALNIDGTWKHKKPSPTTQEQQIYLKEKGFTLPKE